MPTVSASQVFAAKGGGGRRQRLLSSQKDPSVAIRCGKKIKAAARSDYRRGFKNSGLQPVGHLCGGWGLEKKNVQTQRESTTDVGADEREFEVGVRERRRVRW